MLLFNVWFIFSDFPVDCGLQDECNFQLICSALATYWVMLETKAGPLSLWRVLGSPNWGIISLRRTLTTWEAFSVRVGYASTHPEKVFTHTNRYLKFPGIWGIWVKSICQSSVRQVPLCWVPIWGGLTTVLGLFLAQIIQFRVTRWMVFCRWVPII